jgi:general secretion pathway protein K
MIKRPQRGAALLTAMVIVTLVASLAAAMVWRQYRSVQIEAADRARAQAGWVLIGALDWARLFLREDDPKTDHLGEVWAVPLAEARLSTFLAADRNATSEDDGPEAFLSGSIEDAQSRYNLANLARSKEPDAAEQRVVERLAEGAGLARDQAETWVRQLRAALVANNDAEDAPLRPRQFAQMAWLGMDEATRAKLEPWLVLLPQPTPVNLNTAPVEVIAALFDGVDRGTATRWVQQRKNRPFNSVDDIKQQLPQGHPALAAGFGEGRVSVTSNYFVVTGRLRLEERVMEQHSLVQREAGTRRVVVLRRERAQSLADAETRKRPPLLAP